MKDERREILLGYLLGALEPHESAKVDEELGGNESLQKDLAELYNEISPIHEIIDHHEPPVDLAERTCRNLWDKIDAAPSVKSTKNDIFSPHFATPSKKHRATAVFVPPTFNEPSSEHAPPEPSVTAETPDDLISDAITHSVDEAMDVPIPLSRAVQLALDGSLKDPSFSSVKMIRRVDSTEPTPPKPELHRAFAETAKTDKSHQPKYYGRKNTVKSPPRPWSVRDVFASLLVGLTAAVLIFPVIKMGIGNVKGAIIQKKLQAVAQTMAPNTSQYSLSGLTQNDLLALPHMNMDPFQTQNQQAGFAGSFAVSPNHRETSPQMPLLVPTNVSFPASNESLQVAMPQAIQPRSLQIVPDFLTVVDNHPAVLSQPREQVFTSHAIAMDPNPFDGKSPERDMADLLLVRELVNQSCISVSNTNSTVIWHSPGCNFTKVTSDPDLRNSSDCFSLFH